MIATTPIFKILSNHDLDVYVSSQKASLQIISNNPYVKKSFIYDDSTFKKFYHSIVNIRKENFDLAIDTRFHRILDLKHLIYCSFVKTTILMSYNKSNVKSFNISIPYYEKSAHVTNQLKSYLKYLNIEYSDFNYQIYTTYDNVVYTDYFLRKNLLDNFIVLNPFGSKENRSLSNKQINAIVKVLSKKYPLKKIIITGETKKLHTIENKDIILYESRNILDVTSLLEKSSMVISVDTAIVHIATMYNIPTLSLYIEPKSIDRTELKLLLQDNINHFIHKLENNFLDKKYIKTSMPDLSMPINKNIWSPNNPNARQLVFYESLIQNISIEDLISKIEYYLSDKSETFSHI